MGIRVSQELEHDCVADVKVGAWALRQILLCLYGWEILNDSPPSYSSPQVSAPEPGIVRKTIENTGREPGAPLRKSGTWATRLSHRSPPRYLAIVPPGVCGAHGGGHVATLGLFEPPSQLTNDVQAHSAKGTRYENPERRHRP